MKVTSINKRQILIGCDDIGLLESMKSVMDGKKVRGKNQIIIPYKSITKLSYYSDITPIYMDDKSKEILGKVSEVIIRRQKIIKRIRSDYGKAPFDYDYKCTKYPDALEHQKVIFNAIYHSDIVCIDSDPGTCKTGPYIWAIDKRIQMGIIKKAIVITLAPLKQNVLDEMNIQAPHMNGTILPNVNTAEKIINKSYKVKKYNKDYDVYIANYESMYSLSRVIPEDYFQMVVLDECHRIGSPTSRQTKEIMKMFENTPYKVILTGTLHANGLMSFFTPFRFLGPDTVPYARYDEFRSRYMFSVDPDGYVWVPSSGSKQRVQKIVNKITVAFKKEDCLDLPPLIFDTMKCDLEGDQAKAYKDIKKDFITKVENMCNKCDKKGNCDNRCSETIEAKSALTLCWKLQQIAAGFYINTMKSVDQKTGVVHDNSNTIVFNSNPKINLLRQAIDNISENKKIIIWATRTKALELISNMIRSKYGKETYLTCFGSDNAYNVVERFRNGKERFVIANPSKMGVGLNMQFSQYQIFFMNPMSYIQRDQAIGRQHRQGQKERVEVIDLVVRGTIDEGVLSDLKKKNDLNITLSRLARVV